MTNFSMSDAEYRDICSLVYQHTGITLTEEKRKLAYSRFSKRLKALKLRSFRDYCDLIKSNNEDELINFSNAITTNLTSFFREAHHFERLRDQIMPELLKKSSRKIRIWSAGCSSGEEPYSIAITLLKEFPNIANWDVKILATDLDSDILSKASKGIYTSRCLNELDPSIVDEWFTPGMLNGEKAYQVDPKVRKLISFKKLNLMDKSWPMQGPFDVIFCRNVLIYFDRKTQSDLFARFSTLQNVGEHLIIGHSEIMKGMSTKYENMGRTSYIKID